jgi:hypothetical protein
MPVTTSRWGFDRAELVSTAMAFAVSSALYVARRHPYLARGVIGDLVGLSLMSLVVLRWRRRLRHEALVCLGCIGFVLALDPGWPLRVSDVVWWSAVVAGVAVYLAVRWRCLLDQ